MIHSIEVTNHKGETLLLELAKPYQTGLALQSVDGLGPPSISINSTEFANVDGTAVNSMVGQSRNIIFTFILLPKDTIEESRLRIYRYFPIKHQIEITVHTDNRNLGTVGYVETIEPDIFSKPEKVQVSMVMPDPFLYSLYNSDVLFAGVQPMFEFPFCDDSIETLTITTTKEIVLPTAEYVGNGTWSISTAEVGPVTVLVVNFAGDPDAKLIVRTTEGGSFTLTPETNSLIFKDMMGDDYLTNNLKIPWEEVEKETLEESTHNGGSLEFGSIRLDTRSSFEYEGDVDTGMVIVVHALSQITEDIIIYNVDTRERFTIYTSKIRTITGSYFSNTEDIYISTVKGDKYVRLYRNGIFTNTLSAIDLKSDWFQLTPGLNTFTYTGAGENTNIIVTFRYRNAYSGI